MSRRLLAHIRDSLRSRRGASYRTEVSQTYETAPGRIGRRDLQFLRPRLYCYAFPRHYETMPASEPVEQSIHVRVTNAGGAPSHRCMVRFVTQEGRGGSSSDRTISLQPGETRRLTFRVDLVNPGLRGYRVVCFDPLHDPVATRFPASAVLPGGGTPVSEGGPGWVEFRRGANGQLQSVGGSPYANWATRSVFAPLTTSTGVVSLDPPPARALLEPPSYLESSRGDYAELRKTFELNDQTLPGRFRRFLAQGDLLVTLDGYVRTEQDPKRVRAWMVVGFLSAASEPLASIRTTPAAEDGVWIRHVQAGAVPPGTEALSLRLIVERPLGGTASAYFDELDLTLTHRNVFASERVDPLS